MAIRMAESAFSEGCMASRDGEPIAYIGAGMNAMASVTSCSRLVTLWLDQGVHGPCCDPETFSGASTSPALNDQNPHARVLLTTISSGSVYPPAISTRKTTPISVGQ